MLVGVWYLDDPTKHLWLIKLIFLLLSFTVQGTENYKLDIFLPYKLI